MNKHLLWGIWAVAIVSLAVRLIGLTAIHQVVFDEVHFGKFVSSYCCTHERFFDIHPPVGKLIIAGGAYLMGYRGEFSFDSIGQDYGDSTIFGLRLTPAFAGALLPIIVLILLRQVGVSLPLAIVGGVAVALDNALIVESRIIITDSILLAATFGALSCGLAATRAKTSRSAWLFAIAAGALSGAAVGTKFTGLVAGGLVGLLFFARMMLPSMKDATVWGLRLLGAIAAAAAVYLISWMLHFSLLTMPGSGDVWGVPTGSFWNDLVHTHQQMVSANYNLTATHPYGSKWWTWPFMVRSVFYWQGEANHFMYLLGNPFVWWGSFALLCFGMGTFFWKIAKGKMSAVQGFFSSGAWIFLVGYLVSYVPLMRVPRVLFLYHYLTPLLFSLLLGVWWLDRLFPDKRRVVVISIACIAVGFLYISPLTYGFELPSWWYNLLFTFTMWR